LYESHLNITSGVKLSIIYEPDLGLWSYSRRLQTFYRILVTPKNRIKIVIVITLLIIS